LGNFSSIWIYIFKLKKCTFVNFSLIFSSSITHYCELWVDDFGGILLTFHNIINFWLSSSKTFLLRQHFFNVNHNCNECMFSFNKDRNFFGSISMDTFKLNLLVCQLNVTTLKFLLKIKKLFWSYMLLKLRGYFPNYENFTITIFSSQEEVQNSSALSFRYYLIESWFSTKKHMKISFSNNFPCMLAHLVSEKEQEAKLIIFQKRWKWKFQCAQLSRILNLIRSSLACIWQFVATTMSF
jgi:hypothetical protein